MNYLPSRKASQVLGLHPNTLRKYADNGTIHTIKNNAGQRLYDVQSYINLSSSVDEFVCYCRVSSKKQQDDLQRQVAYMSSLYPNATVIQDIGSGINYKRKGLQTLLERLIKGDKFTLVVDHKDRLVRFGFELFEFLFNQNNGKILVLNNNSGDPQTELTNDILRILYDYSSSVPRLRKYYNKIKEDFPEANKETEETT